MINKFKINTQQLPIKAHYFFFMGAMGPILPFISVYGKQLGISSTAMGTITAILPILFFLIKPVSGFLVDYFFNQKKTIFICIVLSASLCLVLIYFLPKQPGEPDEYLNKELKYLLPHFFNVHYFCDMESINMNRSCQKINYQVKIQCLWNHDDLEQVFLASAIIEDDLKNNSELICWDFDDQTNQTISENKTICNITEDMYNNCSISCQVTNVEVNEPKECLYKSIRFWGFVLLVTIGIICSHITDFISDAICYDILGDGHHTGYGRQRVWGAVGYGLTALVAGYAIDLASGDASTKNYTPVCIFTIFFTFFDIICCRKLELPIMLGSESITKDIFKLLKKKAIAIFIIYVAVTGVLNSFYQCFMFWYLEDLAVQTNHTHQIKLIEGFIIAAGTLGGEIIFFPLSGKMLKKLGYGYSFTFSFISFALRFGLMSLIPNPWWAIPINLILQGPAYSLSFTIISGYASVVAPSGTSATVQGFFAGINDGLGFAIGSFTGGILYKKIGGELTLRIFFGIGIIAALSYPLLYKAILKYEMPKMRKDKRCARNHEDVMLKSPQIAINDCDTANDVISF